MAVKKQESSEIVIEHINMGGSVVWIKGISPFIFNAMSEKARHELLFPQKKTKADREQKLKHDPLDEYRNSVYRRLGTGATRLIFPAAGFKGAMAEAALDIPGANKTQIKRLVWVEGDYVDMYGVPKMLMSVVRSSDMNHTPDVRTRAILSEWACKITIKYPVPTLNQVSIGNLLAAAGLMIGVGDFRQGKGKGNYGQFEMCSEADAAQIVKAGGLAAQDKALEKPEYYDVETEGLYTWFEGERKKRGK
jgi:hypothetical protein